MHTLCIMTLSRFAGLSLAGFIQYFHQIVVHTNWFESYEAAVICTDDIWRESFSPMTKTNTSIKTHIRKWNFTQTCSSIDLWMLIWSVFVHWQNRYLLKIKTFFILWCWLSCYLTIFKKNSNNNDHLDIFFF